MRFEVQGIVDGEPRIVLEHVTRLDDALAPEWPQPVGHSGYRVVVSGSPTYTCDVQMMGDDGDHNTAGLVGTAARIVNAIPAVCAARAGPALGPRSAARHRSGARAGRADRSPVATALLAPSPLDLAWASPLLLLGTVFGVSGVELRRTAPGGGRTANPRRTAGELWAVQPGRTSSPRSGNTRPTLASRYSP